MNLEYSEDDNDHSPYTNDNFGKAFKKVENKLKDKILSNLERIAKYEWNSSIQEDAMRHLAKTKDKRATQILIQQLLVIEQHQ